MKPIVTKKNRNWCIQSSAQRVLEILFRFPEKEFSLSGLSQESRVAKPHIGSILADLEREGLITITKLSKIWRIKAELQNQLFLRSKIVYNLSLIFGSGLVEFLNDRFRHPKAIILFGSFRAGEDFSTSDIDIAIEMDKEQEYETLQLEKLHEIEQLLGRKVQVHLFHPQKIDRHVFNNIINGMVLSGFLEVNP